MQIWHSKPFISLNIFLGNKKETGYTWPWNFLLVSCPITIKPTKMKVVIPKQLKCDVTMWKNVQTWLYSRYYSIIPDHHMPNK